MTIKEVLERWREILIGVKFKGCDTKVEKQLKSLRRIFRSKYKNELRNSKGIEEFLKRYGEEIADSEIEKRVISLYRLLSF